LRNNRVKQLREERIWTITELARRADLVPQTISRMESGKPTRKISELKVAKALGLPHREVFDVDE